jgi:membrane protein required for colicin V production
MPITWLDVIVVLLMMISAFLAMLRGLTREMLSIMSWALAALAALFVFSVYRDRVESWMDSKVLADAVLIVAVFVIVLVVVSLITVHLSDRVLDSRVGAIDRTLGFVFGLARGFLLVVIAFELYIKIVPAETHPEWVAQAKSHGAIVKAGDALISILPDNPFSRLSKDRQSSLPVPGTFAGLGGETIPIQLNQVYSGRAG